MSHFIELCGVCGVVISQCRCIDANKEKRYGVCSKHRSYEWLTDPLKEWTQREDKTRALFIVAGSYKAAEEFTQRKHIPSILWKYTDSHSLLQGRLDIDIAFLPGWEELPQATMINDYCTHLVSLGRANRFTVDWK